jgi:uncharacterized repeat protein (TIGR03803 family)
MKTSIISHARIALAWLCLSAFIFPFCDARAQTWATNTPLQVARWDHTTTLLSNNTLLVAGGAVYNMSGDFVDTNAAEIYNPLAGTTTLVGSMNDTRHSHQATLLQNGRVLITGGGGDGSSEEYDPTAQSWTNFSYMNEERLAFTATLLTNGLVLAAGGYDDSQGIEVTNTEVYDPGSQTWTTTTPMPYAADTLAAVLLPSGKVLVCGGYNGTNDVTNAVIYDPAAQTWTYTGPMNEPRDGHAATLLKNGKVLVEGGNYDNSAEIYDPGTGHWTVAGSMNDGHENVDAVLLTNGEVLVTGDGDTNTEVYNPTNNTWSYTTNSLPVGGNSQTETLLSGGQVVVTGGSVSSFNGPPLNVVESFGAVLSSHTLTVTASPTNGLSPLAVHFTSPGMDSGGNTVTNWNWNFGDGTFSPAQSPVHTYTNAGTFSPSLTAFSTFSGAPLQVIGLGRITVTVPTLNVTFNPNTGAAPLTVYFYSPGTDSLGYTVTNWNWSFGDGGVSAAQNPVHTYTNAGGYFPSLTARSTSGPTPLAVSGLSGISVTNPANPNFRALYTFNPTSGGNSTNIDGSGPSSGLLLSGNILYGTTGGGGSKGEGVIFAFNTVSLTFSNVFNFGTVTNSGGGPVGGMVLTNGTLYGVTASGGSSSGGGAVFAVSTNGTQYTNLYSFAIAPPNTGSEPQAGVTLTGNTLYGGTQYGGGKDAGVVYAVATNGSTFSDQYSFSMPIGDYRMNGDGDGCFGRIISANGVLYGTTEAGGTAGDGVVFSVATNNSGSFQVLHYFSAYNLTTATNTDGAFPFSDLVLLSNWLYGTTFAGGFYGNGTIFAVNITNMAFTNLYNFTGTNDGSEPHGGLTLSGNTLYGTTEYGGTNGDGTLFSISTSGANFKTLYSFSGGSDGLNPQADLVVAGNVIYGTSESGTTGSGTLFSYTLPPTGPVIVLTNQLKLANGDFRFGFTNLHGSTNTVFSATNVATPFTNWISLGMATEISNGVFQFTDTTTNLNRRYYRVVSP